MTEKHDVFVGNVTFNTTEEQLQEIFSYVGPIKNVRILQDKESGRPKGFAFIEYYDANTALAAIRRLDQTELNGRKLRVSYSNNSNLKDLARQIGQVQCTIF
jgi:cleavage stimulation factor subunit 2